MADTPEWALELSNQVMDCMEGLTFFETRYYAPGENTFETHLLEIAPVKLEIAEAGENDGEEIYDSSFGIDLLRLKGIFTRVVDFHSGTDYTTFSRTFTMEATYQRRKVFLILRTAPFEDAETVGRVYKGGKFEFFKDVDIE